MKIALYGGSFNPPHMGHIEAARTVSESLAPDMFLIVPDRIPPHKEMDAESPSPAERLELCRIAFRSVPGCTVSDMELKRDGKSYTADTVDQLKKKYPGDELYIVIGTDMLLTFEQWYRFQYILENCSLAVLGRENDDREALKNHAEYLKKEYGAKIILLPHEPLPMSSSDIREKLRLRMGRELLDDEVYAHIIKKGFYDALPELSWLRSRAYEYLDSRRVAHVAGCEAEAVMLARRWGEDEETAATAGILHDITKKLSYEEQLILCDKYGIILDNVLRHEPLLLHAVTGAPLSQELFGVSDKIAQAIRWHTTGKPDMTLLEKIIYLADYIEPNRDFPGLDRVRELAYEDIDAAMALALKMSTDNIRSRGREPYKDTTDALRWYTPSGQ